MFVIRGNVVECGGVEYGRRFVIELMNLISSAELCGIINYRPNRILNLNI